MGRGKNLTPDEKDTIRTLTIKGLSCAKIGAVIKRSRMAVNEEQRRQKADGIQLDLPLDRIEADQ